MLSCSGCASIFCGDDKTISVSSHPKGAVFEITGPSGKVFIKNTTPTNVTLKRGRGYFKAGDYKVTFKKQGYKDLTVPIEQGFETGWYFAGNTIVFGGLIGILIVDPLTGAMYTIEDVNVSLELIETIKTSDGQQQQIKGYKAKKDPKTGAYKTYPVYEKKE
jgi:hypothetical protein